MKKMIVALLALVLVFSFVSCDAMLDVMNKMGNNVAGTEKKVIEDSLNAAKPSTSKSETNDDGSKSFVFGGGEDTKTLFTVSDTGSTLTLGEGTSALSIDLTEGALAGVDAILTPTDLTDVLNGLKSGSKSEIEEELKKPADKDSAAAAKGTQQVIGALVDTLGLPEPVKPEDLAEMSVDERKEAEALNSALDTLNSILGKTGEGEEEKPMTQADVVVLTAITNFVFNNVEDVIGSMGVISSDTSSDKEKEDAEKALTEAVANEAVTLIDVVSVVPSDMASGILDVLNLLTSSSK